MPTGTTDTPQADDQLVDLRLGTRVKVCGITERGEVDLLASRRVDFVGLWYLVPGGPADLTLDRWRELAVAAVQTSRLAPVLVTFSKDLEALRGALTGSPVRWVQLHGYQTPGFVKGVKRIGAELKVIKVLHVRGNECVEASLIGSYERAGVDLFLFDAVAKDGRVGSTGEVLDASYVASLVAKLTRPYLIAGGISSENRDQYEALVRQPNYLGIDVDTNARGADRKVSADKVEAIVEAWKERRA